MGKRDDEYRSQQMITRRLNGMAMSEDKTSRERINEDIREWTHGFWYHKFIKIRNILRQSEISGESRCSKIQEVIDTPKEKWID